MTQLALFNYDQLDAETRIITQQRAGEIKTLMRATAENIMQVGEKLLEVQVKLGNGQFDAWLQAEFDWSRRTAYNFIGVHKQFRGRANFAQMDVATSALYLLAAPSTPESAVDEVLSRAEAGERISHTEAKAIVTEHKAAVAARTPQQTALAPDEPAPWEERNTEKCPTCGQTANFPRGGWTCDGCDKSCSKLEAQYEAEGGLVCKKCHQTNHHTTTSAAPTALDRLREQAKPITPPATTLMADRVKAKAEASREQAQSLGKSIKAQPPTVTLDFSAPVEVEEAGGLNFNMAASLKPDLLLNIRLKRGEVWAFELEINAEGGLLKGYIPLYYSGLYTDLQSVLRLSVIDYLESEEGITNE